MENDAAVTAYVQQLGRLRALAARLVEHCDNHGDIGPDEVTWGHVGSLDYAIGKLGDAVKHLIGENVT